MQQGKDFQNHTQYCRNHTQVQAVYHSAGPYTDIAQCNGAASWWTAVL